MLDGLFLHPKVIVELGMGDGRLLESLAMRDANSFYIGIEVNKEQCEQARARITLPNVAIMSDSFEDIVLTFPDGSVDRFMAVLPDPAFIDEKSESRWKPFYKTVYNKLKRGGTFQLIAEITDELLQPVDDKVYSKWAVWLESSLISIGFILKSRQEGAPMHYSSRCLDQFRGDPKRVRMTTLELGK